MNTAVLLFNHSEKQKASLREIAPKISNKKLNSLIGELNSRAQKVSRKSGLPFFQVDATHQGSFGEQLFQAYQSLFELGYDAVIGISNDCPSLSTADLERAIDAFQNNNIVLGPAKDGGLYLLGIKKKSITETEFLALNWQSETLYDGFQKLAHQKDWCVKRLDEKADIDTVKEFQIAFNSHFQFLTHFKSQLLSFCERFIPFVQERTFQVVHHNFSLRGPPVR